MKVALLNKIHDTHHYFPLASCAIHGNICVRHALLHRVLYSLAFSWRLEIYQSVERMNIYRYFLFSCTTVVLIDKDSVI